MEEMHLKQIDLITEIGGKSRVSEILNRKRRLTVEMIRKLAKSRLCRIGIKMFDVRMFDVKMFEIPLPRTAEL